MSLNINKTVLVTGASGVLGRQVTNRFMDAGWNVTGDSYLWGINWLKKTNKSFWSYSGLANTRANKNHLIRCDLCNFDETNTIIRDVKVELLK